MPYGDNETHGSLFGLMVYTVNGAPIIRAYGPVP